MSGHGWNLFGAVVISLFVLDGSNTASGLSLFQSSYNFSDSGESPAISSNESENQTPQNGLAGNVPPEVLKALYPNGTPSPQSNQTPSFFNQPTSPSLEVAEPVRFNESLVNERGPQVRVEETQQQREPQATSNTPIRSHRPSEFRDLLEHPLTNQSGNSSRAQTGNFSREIMVDPEVIQASASLDRGSNLRISTMMEPVRLPVESARVIGPESRMPAAMETNYSDPRFETANNPGFKGPSLSEILDESNREIGQKRSKAISQESPTKSAKSRDGIELGQKIQQISIVLCLVLTMGVGFIFLAKLWFRKRSDGNSQNGPKKNETNQSASRIHSRIHLTTSLRLDSKSTLHLVEAGNQRVLVATDLNGIKSVVALTPSFEAEFGSMLAPEQSQPSAQERKKPHFEDDFDETYSPVAKPYQLGKKLETRDQYPSSEDSQRDNRTQKSTVELETEMRQQLAELLGGQAFKDVFMQQAVGSKR